MTALYPSTSAAQVFVPVPVRLSTTGASAPIAPLFAFVGGLANFNLIVTDPAANLIGSGQMNALPAGITVADAGLGFLVSIAASEFSVPGQYVCFVSYTPDSNYRFESASFQWGGWIDTLLSSTANAEGASEICQNVLTGSYDVDDPAAPTVQTLSVSGTPYATRTIANADGSAINPSQVLILGELTQVP